MTVVAYIPETNYQHKLENKYLPRIREANFCENTHNPDSLNSIIDNGHF